MVPSHICYQYTNVQLGSEKSNAHDNLFIVSILIRLELHFGLGWKALIDPE